MGNEHSIPSSSVEDGREEGRRRWAQGRLNNPRLENDKQEALEAGRLAAEEHNHMQAEEDARKKSEEHARKETEKEAAAKATREKAAREKQQLQMKLEKQAKENEQAQKRLKEAELAKQAEMRKKLATRERPSEAIPRQPAKQIPNAPSGPSAGLKSGGSKLSDSNPLQDWRPRKQPASKDAEPDRVDNQSHQGRSQAESSRQTEVRLPEPSRRDSQPRVDSPLSASSNGNARNSLATHSSTRTASVSTSSNFSETGSNATTAGIPVKRKASDASNSDREPTNSIGRIPKKPRTPMSASQSPQSPPDGTSPSIDERLNGPAWYQDIHLPKEKSRKGTYDGGTATILEKLKTQITRAKEAYQKRGNVNHHFQDARTFVHQLCFQSVNEKLLKQYRMLHGNNGLPQIFDSAFSGGVQWPFDIKSDAEELYNKWCRQDFDTDLMRGIKVGKAADRSTDSIDKRYENRVDSHFHGNGKLLNGQWWPTQLTALRDGAHGESQGGICGSLAKGAYSVIMSRGPQYNNEDYGDVVLYCGTDSSKEDEVTDNTQCLLKNLENKEPVRLIRSSQMTIKEWAPQIGFRYDGLYDVKEVERHQAPQGFYQRHRFRLVRRAGQDAIRGGTGPEARPTMDEIEAFEKHKFLARGKGS
ncbi:unnamed protein product [Lecanosticta acicola]|uniref:Unnamed protein product n=1 Tax=Lecanosticta acicola TaxID=111012 RepID=A0AAI8W113_9PEZI|nr:unnamed protein product [Lecanosticta acicola]